MTLSLDVYREVLGFKNKRECSREKEYGYDEAEIALRQDLALNKVVWYNSLARDWWSWTRNMHPFVSMFLAHRLHPVTPLMRSSVTWLLLVADFTFSILTSVSASCGLKSCPRWPKNDDSTPTVNRAVMKARWCCIASTSGMIKTERHIKQVGLTILFAISTLVLGQVWSLLVSAACCQGRPSRARRDWERFGKVCLVVMVLGSIVGFVYDFYFMLRMSLLTSSLNNFFMMRAVSYVGAFLLQTCIFWVLWHRQVGDPERHCARHNLVYQDVLDMQAARDGYPHITFQRFNSLHGVTPVELRSRDNKVSLIPPHHFHSKPSSQGEAHDEPDLRA